MVLFTRKKTGGYKDIIGASGHVRTPKMISFINAEKNYCKKKNCKFCSVSIEKWKTIIRIVTIIIDKNDIKLNTHHNSK